MTKRDQEGTRNYFVSTEDASTQSYKAEDVILKVEEAMNLLAVKYFAEVKFVTCDSEGAHIKARRLLKEKYPSMVFLPCSAHQVNLMIKDSLKVVKDFASTVKDALKVVTLLSQRTAAIGILREEQLRFYKKTIAISKPTDTRWYSYHNTLRAISESRTALQVNKATFRIF